MSTQSLPRRAFTRKEAAEMYGVSEETIRLAKNAGALKAKRLTRDETRKGGKELYRLEDLESWFDGLADA